MSEITLTKEQQEIIDSTESNFVLALAGCISGDSIIRFNRASKGFSMPIERAYTQMHREGVTRSGRMWDKNIKTKVRSFNGKKVRLNEIHDIVQSGIKPVHLLELECGFSIKATEDHKILTENGWKTLGSLSPQDMVAVDYLLGSRYKMKDNLVKAPKIIDKYKSVGKNHPYAKRDKDKVCRRLTLHVLAYELHINNMSLEQFKEATNGNVSVLKFINPREFSIHHKDFNHFNNEFSNLQLVSNKEHSSIHSLADNGYGTVEYSQVKAVTFAGEEMTYDIQCCDPHHNFVANNIVVHNSGKTSTIVLKIDKILSSNPGARVLYLTFTRKGKEEGIKKLGHHKGVTVTNFHGLSYAVLNHHLDILGVKNIDIVPDSYCIEILSNLFPTDKREEIFKKLELVDTIKESNKQVGDLNPIEKAIFLPFQKVMDSTRKMRYSDLVYRMNQLISNRKLKLYCKKMLLTYDFIFVDEVQDTNRAQYTLIDNLLALNPKTVIQCIGDFFQSIYRWRSSDPTQALEFIEKKDFKIKTLSSNFRSQKKIIDFSNIFLSHCEEFSQLRSGLMVSTKPEGDTVKWVYQETPEEQYSFICETIHDMVANGEYKYGEVGILYRMNRTGSMLEKVALKKKLPLFLVKGSLLNRDEVQYFISVIRFCIAVAQEDEEDIRKYLSSFSEQMAADIGIESFRLIVAETKDDRILDVIESLANKKVKGIGPKRKESFLNFYRKIVDVINDYNLYLKDGGEVRFFNCVEEMVMKFKFAVKYSQINYNLAKETLIDIIEIFTNSTGTVSERINQFMIDYAVDTVKDSDNKVVGMTVHKAKGLEFKVVFVADFENFPMRSSEDEEEEKRILYVAMTRAKEKLIITSSGYRFIYLDWLKKCKVLETNVPLESINTEEDFYGSPNRKFY